LEETRVKKRSITAKTKPKGRGGGGGGANPDKVERDMKRRGGTTWIVSAVKGGNSFLTVKDWLYERGQQKNRPFLQQERGEKPGGKTDLYSQEEKNQ